MPLSVCVCVCAYVFSLYDLLYAPIPDVARVGALIIIIMMIIIMSHRLSLENANLPTMCVCVYRSAYVV